MLVQYGGGILDARGSVGGQVHSRNRFGNYVRARTTPVNPQSARQSGVRNPCSNLSPRWSNEMTPAERAGWDQYAATITFTNKLGEQIKLTGFNHYMRTNIFRRQNLATRIMTPPTTLTLAPTDDLFAAVVDEATQKIAVTFDETMDWVGEDDGIMGVYMSMPQAAGTKFITGPWRLAGTILGNSTTAPTSPADLDAPFVVAQGQRVAVRARICEEDGRLSELFRDVSAVTA